MNHQSYQRYFKLYQLLIEGEFDLMASNKKFMEIIQDLRAECVFTRKFSCLMIGLFIKKNRQDNKMLDLLHFILPSSTSRNGRFFMNTTAQNISSYINWLEKNRFNSDPQALVQFSRYCGGQHLLKPGHNNIAQLNQLQASKVFSETTKLTTTILDQIPDPKQCLVWVDLTQISNPKKLEIECGLIEALTKDHDAPQGLKRKNSLEGIFSSEDESESDSMSMGEFDVSEFKHNLRELECKSPWSMKEETRPQATSISKEDRSPLDTKDNQRVKLFISERKVQTTRTPIPFNLPKKFKFKEDSCVNFSDNSVPTSSKKRKKSAFYSPKVQTHIQNPEETSQTASKISSFNYRKRAQSLKPKARKTNETSFKIKIITGSGISSQNHSDRRNSIFSPVPLFKSQLQNPSRQTTDKIQIHKRTKRGVGIKLKALSTQPPKRKVFLSSKHRKKDNIFHVAGSDSASTRPSNFSRSSTVPFRIRRKEGNSSTNGKRKTPRLKRKNLDKNGLTSWEKSPAKLKRRGIKNTRELLQHISDSTSNSFFLKRKKTTKRSGKLL